MKVMTPEQEAEQRALEALRRLHRFEISERGQAASYPARERVRVEVLHDAASSWVYGHGATLYEAAQRALAQCNVVLE